MSPQCFELGIVLLPGFYMIIWTATRKLFIRIFMCQFILLYLGMVTLCVYLICVLYCRNCIPFAFCKP